MWKAPFFFRPYGPFLDGGIISNNATLDVLAEFFAYVRAREFIARRQQTAEQLYAATTSATNNTSHLIQIKPTSTSSITSNIGNNISPAISQSNLSNITSFDNNNVAIVKKDQLELVLSLGTGRGRVAMRQRMLDFGTVTSGFARVFAPVELLRSIRAARDLFRKLMHQSCQTEDHVLDRAQAWCSSLKVPYFRINPPLSSVFSMDDKRDEQLVNALWQTKLYMRAMSGQLAQLAHLLDND